MNDYANFYRQIAELERQAERGNRRQRRSGAAWERTPEANAPQEVPRFSPQEVQRLERETEVESARQRARREYSPLPDEAGPLVPLTAMVGDLVQAPNDAILAREGDPRAQRRLGERDARWSRGAERAGQDILAEGHGGQIMQFFSDLPEQMDEAERARLEAGGRDAPLDRVGSVLGGLWTGMASAPREARGEVAAQDAIRAQHRDDAAEAMARGDDIGARSAALSGRMAEQAGDRSAGEDFWYNAPWAAEFVPGVGLVDMAASAGRFGARQGWRAAGQEIPEALARPQGFAETQRLGVRTGEVGANGEDILYSATGNARGWRNNAAAGGAAYLAADSADGELGDDPVASAAVGGGVMALGRRFIPNIDSAIPEEIQHLMRQGEIGPDGARNYTPRPGQRLTVDPEGRVAMDYQGSFNSGGGDSVEALSIARGAREALDDDIATTRRSEYSWTPNDERQAGFYRRTLGRTAPDGYAFSETPRGEMRLRRLGAEFEPDPLEAVPVADDAPFGFEGAPGAGRIIDAEATPVPARRFEAAIRDPETGRVYTGQDHYDAIASAPDDVQARLSEIYEARVEDQSVIGFQVDGQFMGREEGLQALRAQRRPVRIGEQVNRDGSVTPRSPIDWENGSNRLPADDEWFNTLAGMPTPPRMNIVPDGGIPGRSADDMLRDVPDAGQARIGQSGAQSDLFPETAPSPERVFHGTTGDFDPEQIAPWSHFGTERAARHRLEAQVDPQFRDSPDGPNMRVLPYEITGRRIDVGREFDTPGMENSPKDIADLLLRGRHITPEEHAWALEPHQGGARFEGRNADEVIWERLSELADRHDIGAIGYQNAVEDAGSRSYLVPNPRNVRAAPQEAPYGYYTGPDGVRRPMEPPLYTLTPAPDGGASGAGNRGDLFPGSAPGPVQVLEGEIIPPSRGGVSTTPSDGAVAGVVGALEPMIPEMRAAQADIRRVLGDEEYFAPRQPIDVDALEPNRRAIARASVALEEFVAQNRALRAEQAARALPDGGASGAGNAADRFRTNDTPVPVNEGWDTAGSLQQGVDDLAAQRGGWDTMGGRDMGEALIRRHGLDGALEQINRIMADPASRRARQRNGDQGAWEAVQRYIQASVNRRGIGLAPDAPNAGPRRLGGDDTPAAATISAGGLGGYALGEMLDDEAQAADGSESDGAMLPILTAGGGAAALYAMRRGRLGEQFGDSVGMSGGRGARRLGGERGANPDLGLNAVETEARTAGEQTGLSAAQRGALTPDQSYIIERRMQGADYNTIADEMSTAERPVTTNTVTVQISKARRRLSDAGMPLDMASAPMGRPSYAAATDEQIIALRDQLRSSGEGNARGGVNTIIAERFGMTPNAVAQRISNWERRRNTGAAAGLTALGGGALLLGDEAQAQSFDPNGQWIGEEQRRDVGDRTEIRQRFRDSQGRIFEGVRYQDHATGAISAPQLSPVGETPMPQLGDTYDSSEVPLRPEEIERIQAEREANGGAPPAQAPSRRLGNESRSDNTTPAWALAAPLIAGIAGGRIGREWGLRNGRPIAGEALGAAGTGSAVGAASGAFTDAKDSGELTVLGSGLGLGGRGAYRLGEAGVRQSADALANVRLPRQRVRGEPLPYVGDDVVAPMNEPGSLRPPPVRQPERMSGSLDEADLAAEMSGRAIEQGRRRLRPTPIPPEERLAIPEGERGSLDGRLATLGSEPLRELARREGLPTEGTVRDLARRLADAARQDPAALERYKRIFQALGVSSLIVGGASQLLPQDAEAVDGGEGLPSWSDEAGVGATAFGLAVLGRTAAPRALEGLVPNRARLGQLSRVSELPMDIPRRTLDLDRSRLGRVAPNRVASDVDPRLVAGGAALAVGPIAWGAAELLDPTTQSPQEQESSFLRDVMPYAEMRQQALELHSQGYTSREIRDIDPEIADEMLILEQGGNSLLNDYEVTPASIPEDIQAARAYRAREEQKRNPQRLGR